MELHVTLAVLCAALCHATWNALIKGGKAPLFDSMLISTVWIFICIVAFPFLPAPHPDSWPFIAMSVVVHVSYFFLLAMSYHHGELSQVYPIIRGLPPLMVLVVSFLVLKDDISVYGWLGIAAISISILTLEIGNKISSRRVLFLSIATAIMITAYTVIDGVGARLSGNSTSYLSWLAFSQSIIFVSLVAIVKSRKQCIDYACKYWKRGMVGGILSILAYAVVLWAMTQAPIPYVSALRETSVLFASAIAVLFLSESFRMSRMISAIFIVSGVILLKIT